MEVIKLDVKGQDCPVPLIEMKKALKRLESEQLLEIEFTCPEATRSLPSYANEHNHKVISFDRLSGAWKIVLQK